MSSVVPFPSKARLQARGQETADKDLAASGSRSLDEVATLMRLPAGEISRMAKSGVLLALTSQGELRFPSFQFDDSVRIVLGLAEIRRTLNFESPWSVLHYFITPDNALSGRRPIDVLREGNMMAVLTSANTVGVQGA